MIKVIKISLILLCTAIITNQSCMIKKFQKTPQDYNRAIDKYLEKLIKSPENLELIQDIGISYYHINYLKEAQNYLLKAFKKDPKNSKTLKYLNLTLEAQNKKKSSLKKYKEYIKISKLPKSRKNMAVRCRVLERNILQEEMRDSLKTTILTSALNDSLKSVAVLPMSYNGVDDKYSSIGTGLSEMIISDLNQIDDLTVVEHIRQQALFNIIELEDQGLFEKQNAEQIAALLGTTNIFLGSYNIFENDMLAIKLYFWNLIKNELSKPINITHPLKNIFEVKRALVLNILDELKIELTDEKRAEIKYVSTKNMNSFLAYCIGLDLEDSDHFKKAVEYYQLALNLDPKFKYVGNKLDDDKTEINEKKHKESEEEIIEQNQVETTDEIEIHPEADDYKLNLLQNRLLNTQLNINSNLIPGPVSLKKIENTSN